MNNNQPWVEPDETVATNTTSEEPSTETPEEAPAETVEGDTEQKQPEQHKLPRIEDFILAFNEYYMARAELDNYPFYGMDSDMPDVETDTDRIRAIFTANETGLKDRYIRRQALATQYNTLLFKFYEFLCEGNYSIDFSMFMCMWNYVCEGTGDLVTRVTATAEMYRSFNRTLMR
ncbi:MAG: hypothetical protein IJA19_05715 [Clostridia bacterium]|nr:hypothetical protein [Clostridia bacterium]